MKQALLFGVILALVGALMGAIYWKAERADAVGKDGKPIIKIGILAALTGDFADIGNAIVPGIKIFEEQLKKKDTRYQYQFIVEDNQFKAHRSITIVQKLIHLDHVRAIVSLGTWVNNAITPLAEQYKVIHMGSGGFAPDIIKSYSFGIYMDREKLASKMVDELNKRDIKKVAVIYLDTSGLSETVGFLKDKITKSGTMRLTTFEAIGTTQRNFGMTVAKVLKEKPDIVVVQLLQPELEIFTRQLLRQNPQQKITCVEAFSYPDDKSLFEGQWFINNAPPSAEYIRRFQEKTGRNATQFSEFVYAALEMLVAGYEKFGPDNAAVRAYLMSEKFDDTVIGPVYFDAVRSSQYNDAVVQKIQNGKIITVKE